MTDANEGNGTEQTETVTFDETARDFVIDAMGWTVREDGYIDDENGDPVLSPNGETVRADHFAGIVAHEGEPKPIPDDFVDLVDYAVSVGGEA